MILLSGAIWSDHALGYGIHLVRYRNRMYYIGALWHIINLWTAFTFEEISNMKTLYIIVYKKLNFIACTHIKMVLPQLFF